MHEFEGDGQVRNSELFAVVLGKGNFLVVMVAAIIERNGERDFVGAFVKQGGTVHSAGEYQQGVFHGGLLVLFIVRMDFELTGAQI